MKRASASQVGYEGVESLTRAPSEPQVNTVEAAVPEIALRMSSRWCNPGSRDSGWTEARMG